MTLLPAALRSLAAVAVIGTAVLAPMTDAAAGPVLVRDGNGGDVFNGNGVGSVNLTINVNGANKGVAAGAFALQYSTNNGGSWTNLLTYCLEPDELLGISGSTPVAGDLVSSIASTSEYAASASDISRLYRTYFADSLTSSTKSAAFQVAMWELAYDTGKNLALGAFRFTTAGGVLTQASTYLNMANWVPTGDVGVILRIGNQDLLMDAPPNPVEVPEPMSLALFGLGLAGLGLARRRRAAA
ncbi:MAG: PEP-CTERM sorting domain-containing protein [Acetobacteraceae bacterium]|nr:PEP-CTERM sorting domain-containing protein [Acetobacteraceae bacterium]